MNYTKEQCLESAKGYNRVIDWLLNEYKIYNCSLKFHWRDECIAHMFGQMTKKDCLKSARRYHRIIDWFLNEPKFYHYSLLHNWHVECTIHMIHWGKKYSRR